MGAVLQLGSDSLVLLGLSVASEALLVLASLVPLALLVLEFLNLGEGNQPPALFTALLASLSLAFLAALLAASFVVGLRDVRHEGQAVCLRLALLLEGCVGQRVLLLMLLLLFEVN